MSTNKVNLTHAAIDKAKSPDGKKRCYLNDTKTPGLRVQITATGTKTFQFQMRSKQHGVMTKTIGRYGKVSLSEARAEADSLRVRLNGGENIVETVKTMRDENTLSEVFEHYLQTHAIPHKKGKGKEDIGIYNAFIKEPLGNKRISAITLNRVKAWHAAIPLRKKQIGSGCVSGTRANRALGLLSSIFSHSLSHLTNPCSHVKRFSESARERFLQPEEMNAFFTALDAPETTEIFRDFIYLALLTGARRGNLLTMKWNDIDLDHVKASAEGFIPDPLWTIPAADAKKGKPIVIPLQPEAVTILQKRKQDRKSIFVFASHSKKGHYTEPKTSWAALCRRAGLTDLRIHDLRRTLGSYQTMTGASTTVVGKSLGHAPGSPATAVYARLNADTVKDSMRKALDLMQAARDVQPKVVKISGEG